MLSGKKRLAPIKLFQCLHSIITYVGYNSPLSPNVGEEESNTDYNDIIFMRELSFNFNLIKIIVEVYVTKKN